ncbi:MAG TPA: NAD-dependent epimerase/dehydratase family protein [Micropepsaceae bacterium]|nr:NAD-dependent epimerase/dehydratase family protein [Micropepsaceae bacterium]
MQRVCLVGAGFISHVHAEAIRSIPALKLHGVVDTNRSAAEALAARWGIPHVFDSIEKAIASGEVDRVHVLTPPGLHAQTTRPFLRAGIPVFVEKPLAVNSSECEALNSEARLYKTVLGVNQNFVFHPAFTRLRRAIAERRVGKPNFVSCIYNMPLRQITARQFGHWMFREPGNILLEQAVHPLSQIVALAGKIEHFVPMAGAPLEISPGVPFYPSANLMMKGAQLPAELRFAVGQEFPFWQISVVCDDGVAVADMLNNRFFTQQRGRWLGAYDTFLSGARTGLGIMGESLRAALDFSLSTVKLKSRSDSFYQSVKASVEAFHKALDEGRPPELDGEFGAHLVSICEETARIAFTAPFTPARVQSEGDYDVAVLGGTGFIGSHLVKLLLANGQRVGVMARNVANLPAEFFQPGVVVKSGDIGKPADVERAIGNAPFVINLAHGGGGATYEQIRKAMVGGAEIVARACLARGVRRLVHVGSIASLYLGSESSVITGDTPPDPASEMRAEYARAKAECDRMLLAMYRSEGLPVCILRPGLVVGEGGTAVHSGLGFFNNEQHCIGWNTGRNPLPFVLVEDVAAAAWHACTAPNAVGRTYNIVGDVRLSAREYVAELSRALSRPLHFHPQRTRLLWLEETAKWTVKRVTGRKGPRPTYRDLLSRGLLAKFDCEDAKKDLDWHPEGTREKFVEHGIRVFAKT